MERTNFAWLFAGLLLLVALQSTAQTGGFGAAAALEGAFLAVLVLGVWSLRSFPGLVSSWRSAWWRWTSSP